MGSEYAPDEVGVALRLSRGTACARIGLAWRLLATLPDTYALWEAGLIDTAKARAVDDATVVLSDEQARAVQAAVLPQAPEQTLAQLKAALARAVLAADPDGAEERHREARRDRRVVVTAEAGRDGHVVGDAHRHRRRGGVHLADPAGPRPGRRRPAQHGRPPGRHPRRAAERPPGHRPRHRHRHRTPPTTDTAVGAPRRARRRRAGDGEPPADTRPHRRRTDTQRRRRR